MIDAAAYTLWGIFWFISFCIIVHYWNNLDSDYKDDIEAAYGKPVINNILAAITFTSFCVVVWVSLHDEFDNKLFAVFTCGHAGSHYIFRLHFYYPWSGLSMSSQP